MSRDESDDPPPSPPSPRGTREKAKVRKARAEALRGVEAEVARPRRKKRARADESANADTDADESEADEDTDADQDADADQDVDEDAGEGGRASGGSGLPFAAAYPDDPTLRELLRAFEAGDYGRVRREAPRLAARSADPNVAWAARDLRSRLDPDSLTLGIFLGTTALLIFLAAWSYGHMH